MNELDKTDRKILEILQKNARITNKELSSQLGLSPPPTLERVKKLESSGYITGYIAVLDPKKVDLGAVMMVSVTLHQHSEEAIEAFHRAIENLTEVMECYHLTGDDDFILKVVCKDIQQYERFVREKLARLNTLGKIKSSVVLSTVKMVREYPISER
ncbi:Lrp/AsnC family transcriptional regulator [Aliikangiella coralliicola]|uniref:Lrp/AsnC family transcriptional regulator n=1 Tax=Aliikangiella coralliicola TaxID=2592383 RepID=A0A545UBJ7_9GAMM|nr:Lrp/AsnC family transcriptional regulator [Aliikangiella coralliicola]TQV86841.1 Lrp/AsnC family transcriptional regulator [Aliikangiella coralliicola]